MYSHDHENEIVPIGYTSFRNKRIKFGIKTDDRRRHTYVIGKTGMGKTNLLKHLIFADIQAGHGLTVVDPHGELVEEMVRYVPSNRINDVIFFNPADIDYPISFNVLEKVEPEYRHLVASGIVGVFKKLWAESWGPRLEYVLRNAVLALLEYPDSTLLGIMRILVDKAYRKKVIEKVQDPVVRSFWVNEYSKYPDRFQSEAIAPIQNKVGAFLSTSLIRNIIGQVKSTINLREVMDTGKILFLDLSKGRIGEDASSLLGALMITKIQLAAMSRVDAPEENRKDMYLMVDEFQNFATESFATILSEARKYHLNLTIAHQYIEQLDEKVQAAVFGNVGTIITFRIGATDAEQLVKEFTPYFLEEDLVNIPKFNVYLKLMIDGVASDPFSATILPPLTVKEDTGNLEKIIRLSRERYAHPRQIIEEKISRWMENADEQLEHESARMPRAKGFPVNPQSIPARIYEPSQKQQEAQNPVVSRAVSEPEENFQQQSSVPDLEDASLGKYEAICANCKIKTYVSFVPDGVRPVFCKKCLKLEKEKRRELPPTRRAYEIPQKQYSRQASPSYSSEEEEGGKHPSQNATVPPSISLQEALKRGPVGFTKKQQPSTSTSSPSPTEKQPPVQKPRQTFVEPNKVIKLKP